MFIREGTCIRIKYVILSNKSTIISLHKINSIYLRLVSTNVFYLYESIIYSLARIVIFQAIVGVELNHYR